MAFLDFDNRLSFKKLQFHFYVKIKDGEEEDEEDDNSADDVISEKQNGGENGGNGGNGVQKPGLKHSDSSFGLHSPDSYNDDVQVWESVQLWNYSWGEFLLEEAGNLGI